jgi:hypothetical protein
MKLRSNTTRCKLCFAAGNSRNCVALASTSIAIIWFLESSLLLACALFGFDCCTPWLLPTSPLLVWPYSMRAVTRTVTRAVTCRDACCNMPGNALAGSCCNVPVNICAGGAGSVQGGGAAVQEDALLGG